MKWLAIAILIASYVFCYRAAGTYLQRIGKNKDVHWTRVTYLTKTSRFALSIAFIIAVCIVLGLGYTEVSFFFSSVFAVIGVAMFAQWSILSNITASVVIFFGFPYRVGDRIKVTDADFDLSGTVEEISLFNLQLRSEAGNLVTIPNSMLLQRTVIKLERGNKAFPSKVFPPPAVAPAAPAKRAPARKSTPAKKRAAGAAAKKTKD